MNNLSWECHINEMPKKIASRIGAIKRIRYFLPFEILLNVNHSLVQPHFDYCNTVWGNYPENLSSNLQNRAARVLTFSNYDRSASELFQNLNWLTLAHQRVVRTSYLPTRSVKTRDSYIQGRYNQGSYNHGFLCPGI